MKYHVNSRSSSTQNQTPKPPRSRNTCESDTNEPIIGFPDRKSKFERSALKGTINRVERIHSKDTHNSSLQRSSQNATISPKNQIYQSVKCKVLSPRYNIDAVNKDKKILDDMHPEAIEFLKKHFSGCSSRSVSLELFLRHLLFEFQHLWEEKEAPVIIPQLVKRLKLHLGVGFVDLQRYHQKTKQAGLVGMILETLQEIKPIIKHRELNQSIQIQNIKNILQQFIQGLLASSQKQLYSKLNAQMRKLVLKYSEASKLLQDINEKITHNVDKIQLQKNNNQIRKQYESVVETLKEKISTYQITIEKDQLIMSTIKTDNIRLQEQNRRLAATVEKFQDHILKNNGNTLHEQQNKYNISPRKYQPLELLRFQYLTKPDHRVSQNTNESTMSIMKSNFPSMYSLASPTNSNPPLKKTKDIRSDLSSGLKQPDRKYKYRQNIEVYELKKGMSSFLDEKQNSKQLNERLQGNNNLHRTARTLEANRTMKELTVHQIGS